MILTTFVGLSVCLISIAVVTFAIPFSLPEDDDIGSKTTIVSDDADGNFVLSSFNGVQSKRPVYVNPQPNPQENVSISIPFSLPAISIPFATLDDNNSIIYRIFEEDITEARVDYVEIPGNFSREIPDKLAGRATSTGPAIIELVIVVDKEFADVFQQNYQKVVDYLTVYFWDVNMRYKTLWSVDLSFRVNGLLIMASTGAQPFIENARASDGRTEHGRTLNLFKSWIYQQRSWLVKHDMAVLITNSNTEWGGGLAHGGGACSVDTNNGIDWGTVVWNDSGAFTSVTIAAHEMAHNVGAPHDDDPNANCPGPYGFIMSGGNENSRYFFQKCSDASISSYVNSDKGACLRRNDGYETTPMDRSFSSPKATTMLEMCRSVYRDPNAWIDAADTFNCKTMYCKRHDDTNPNIYWIRAISPVDNIQCGNGGRCFRGRCRPESKLLKNEGSGYCMNTNSRFAFTVPAQMFACPSSNEKTPLDTLETINVPTGTLLATPFLNDENKESGDRCFYTGSSDGGWLWTDRCSPVDNIQCGNGGRCFRGRCRPESKLLKNEGSGYCMNTNSRFAFTVPAQMFACPSSNEKTPLDTLETINVPTGTLLATPFLNDENKESGDRCFYTGSSDGGWLWTDRCSTENPWHVWELRAVNGNANRFQLVHKTTGRCAKPISNDSNSNVYSLACTTDASMIWSWIDGA